MQKILRIDPKDNLIVALRDLAQGDIVENDGQRIQLVTDVPAKHKFTRDSVPVGGIVTLYGVPVGKAVAPLQPGERITVDNVVHYAAEVDLSDAVPYMWKAPDVSRWADRTFDGVIRPDGRVGVRNRVLILPASVCASDTARIIAQQVEGAVSFNNQQGCSQVAPDQQFTMDVMAGYAANPNIYGTVVVSLGCENCQMDLVVEAIKERTNKPLKQVIIQEAGGTLKAIDMAVRYAKEMVEEASLLQKEEFPMSELIIGTECGGSDPTSGLAANPLIGQLSDLIVKEGGTSILSETTEFIGAEHLLARRAINKEVHDRIFEIVHRYEDSLRLVGEEVREGNPSPGNKAGGLTCLEEKSLGCIHKGGHSPIMAVYDYAKQVEAKQGLVIMDTPGNDPSSVAAMVAGGAQIVVFSTGRGTPTGNPLAPVIKITGNKLTYANMIDNIDVDASPLIYGTKTIEELGQELLKLTQEVACGKQTKAESLGYTEMAIARVCNFV